MAAVACTDGGEFIIRDRLRGHKGQVLCAAAPESTSRQAVVATGAEDSTVRLWDLRATASSRVALCLCRCFDGEAVTSVVFRPGDANRIYCSAGGKVLEFDLRAKAGGLFLMTSPSATIDAGTEEVNEVAVHPKGEYLAVADDSGVVKVYNASTRRLHKTLRNAHASICHTVRFRPRASWDVASGALDSTLVMWDFSSGKVRRKLDFVDEATGSSSASASSSSSQKVQLFNPPFVYSVDFSLDGRFLAAGLGDSGVIVLDAKTRNPVGRCDGHAAPISQVHYPRFDPTLLVSSGNDRRLLFWDHRPFEQAVESRDGNSSSSKNSRTSAGNSISPRGQGCSPRLRNVEETPGGAQSSNPRKKMGRGRKGKRSSSRAVDQHRAVEPQTPRSILTTPEERSTDNGEEGELPSGEGCQNERGVTCSTALSMVFLEEKPNWVASLDAPYDALVLADTSSEVKILGRRGT
ncbi:unnamed protein product [Ascophyllum nodosum]